MKKEKRHVAGREGCLRATPLLPLQSEKYDTDDQQVYFYELRHREMVGRVGHISHYARPVRALHERTSE